MASHYRKSNHKFHCGLKYSAKKEVRKDWIASCENCRLITNKKKTVSRKKLGEYKGEVITVKAKIRIRKKERIMIENIYREGEKLSDHAWVMKDQILNYNKNIGNYIEFTGTVYEYIDENKKKFSLKEIEILKG